MQFFGEGRRSLCHILDREDKGMVLAFTDFPRWSPALHAWLGLVGMMLCGCQTPAAKPALTAARTSTAQRSLLLARQIVADTAVEVACRPMECGRNCLTEPMDHLLAAGEGLLGKRLLLSCQGKPPAPRRDRSLVDEQALEKAVAQAAGVRSHPVYIDLHPDGAAALEALGRMIGSARRRIDVMMFQWESDALGAAIADWLMTQAGPDLPVRVLVDGGGNLIFGGHKDKAASDVNGVVHALAQHPHVTVLRTRNPFARFDHRKLVLVDGDRAWTGGRNFTRRSFFAQRDLSVTLTGPLVQELQDEFDTFWSRQGGPSPSSEHAVASAESTDTALRQACYEDDPAIGVPARGRLLGTAPAHRPLAKTLYRAIDQAQHHIYLENVYFTDSRLLCKLARARRRGVDVRVVLTIQSHEKVINAANRVTANRLWRAGVRVYLYPGMVHTKAAVVDGCWAYVGTANYDALSLRHNRELGLALSGEPLVAELEERLFQVAFQPEWEMREPLPATWSDYACELLASLCL
ncbi:MAG: phospholipase D-like domain-containing protein [Gemmataceae bacterium]